MSHSPSESIASASPQGSGERSSAGQGHLPGLNGLRAIAAVTVMVIHAQDYLRALDLPILGSTEAAAFAVTVFFALSGFLITYLLLRERQRSGRINTLNFYIRRTLRIWPLYFTFFGLTMLFNVAFAEPVMPGLVPYYLLFAANIPLAAQQFINHASHLWSLSVEEQFYLIWPWLLRFVKRVEFALVAFFLVYWVVKVYLRFHHGGDSIPYTFIQFTRFDCMALGGLGAWLYWRGIPVTLGKIIHSISVQVACWLALVVTVPDWFHVAQPIDHTLIAGATVVIILNLVGNPRPLFALRGRVWEYLGGISFGIYMWHPLVSALVGKAVHPLTMPVPVKISLVMVSVSVFTILIAHLSMKWLETPFLRMKNRFGH